MFVISSYWLALFSQLLWGIIFVAALYLWVLIDPKTAHFSRDQPLIIKRRFASVAVVCLFAVIYARIFWTSSFHENSFWSEIGLKWSIKSWINGSLLPLALTIILFAGPLYLSYLEGDSLIDFGIDDLRFWRNYIVGPLSEEWVFRCCLCPLMISSGWSFYQTIFLSPLGFGLAHLHHFLQRVNKPERLAAFFQSLFQVLYTTIFGAYSAFLFLRTGGMIGPFLVHSFCNIMGFPQFGEMLNHEKKYVILLVLHGGFIAFCFLLFPFTEPSLYQ